MRILLALLLSSGLPALAASPAEPTIEIGVRVFVERCVVCHGERGMGDGSLPIRLEDYPNTNLLENSLTTSHEEIRDAVAYGGSRGAMSNFMPPMGADLSWTETESVALFVALLRTDNAGAARMLRLQTFDSEATTEQGREVFVARCQLCHGKYGEGDGRMAKIIKTPPPANLVASKLADADVFRIIIAGGEGTNRSPQMPPWGDQLSQQEVQAVMLYLKSIRQ